MTKITLKIQDNIQAQPASESENSAPIDKVLGEVEDLGEEVSKPIGISIKIV